MNVGVLFGGKSCEHEVSIITGCLIANALKKKYNVMVLYIDKEQRVYLLKDINIESFRDQSFKKGSKLIEFSFGGFRAKKKFTKIDIGVICNHGVNGEDGLSKALFNFYNIPSVGSPMISSGVSMDKYFTYCVLKDSKVKVLETKCIFRSDLDLPIGNLDFPIIIKPARLGSSIGIDVCRTNHELREKLTACLKYDSKVCVQKYIEDIKEYNVSCYKKGEEIITSRIEVIEQRDNIYSYDEKYQGTKMINHCFLDDEKLAKKIIKMAIKSYEVLELTGVVRIDFFVGNDVLYLNEVNTIPGSLSYYLYDDNIEYLLDDLIHQAMLETSINTIHTFSNNILFYDYQGKK